MADERDIVERLREMEALYSEAADKIEGLRNIIKKQNQKPRESK